MRTQECTHSAVLVAVSRNHDIEALDRAVLCRVLPLTNTVRCGAGILRMNVDDDTPSDSAPTASGLRWPHVVLIVLATIVLTVGVTYWVLSHYLFLKEFRPVSLRPAEAQVLDR